jgi:hypothetical protein
VEDCAAILLLDSHREMLNGVHPIGA